MTIPVRRWPESEIDTLTSMEKVQNLAPEPHTPPAPVKRKIMERDPVVARPPTREEVEQIEDQILRMAFDHAMRRLRIKTIIVAFTCGMVVGFVGLGVTFVVLLEKVGA